MTVNNDNCLELIKFWFEFDNFSLKRFFHFYETKNNFYFQLGESFFYKLDCLFFMSQQP